MAFLGGFFWGGWKKDGRWLPYYLKVTTLEEEGAFLPLRKLSSFSWPFKNTCPLLEQNFANLYFQAFLSSHKVWCMSLIF